jgi:receptor-type tyrosine-protein phosphatase Q
MFSITGVGIFANNNPVSNNTAILADSNNQTGVIYCNSGSKVAGIGQWFSPSGAEIVRSSGGTFTVVRGGGSIPSFIGLQLRAGQSFSVSDEGIYTCLIPDENGIQQVLQIGLYHNGYIG